MLIRSEAKRLGLASVKCAEDSVLLRLCNATGGTPLAIKWAVGQIKQKGQSLDKVLDTLRRGRGDVFDCIFSRSWELLLADSQQIIMAMSLFASSASRAGIETVSDVHDFALDTALGQLVEMSLLDTASELDASLQRYSIHPLTRSFASAQLKRKQQFEKASQNRYVEFFHAFARKHGDYWNLHGFTQIDPELPNILTAVQWCWDHQLGILAADLLYYVFYYMINRGYWDNMLELSQQAITRANEVDDKLRSARFQVWPVCWILCHRGNLDLARKLGMQALTILEQLDQEQDKYIYRQYVQSYAAFSGKVLPEGYVTQLVRMSHENLHVPEWDIALAKHNLGRIAQDQGSLEQAEQLLKEAFAYYRSLPGREAEGLVYYVTGDLADVVLQQGNLNEAWKLSNEALLPAQRFGDVEIEAQLLNILGDVARQRGNLEAAKGFLEKALGCRRRSKRLDAFADALFRLARVEIEMEQYKIARQMLLDALEIYQKLAVEPRIREIEALAAKLPGALS